LIVRIDIACLSGPTKRTLPDTQACPCSRTSWVSPSSDSQPDSANWASKNETSYLVRPHTITFLALHPLIIMPRHRTHTQTRSATSRQWARSDSPGTGRTSGTSAQPCCSRRSVHRWRNGGRGRPSNTRTQRQQQQQQQRRIEVTRGYRLDSTSLRATVVILFAIGAKNRIS